MKSWHIDRRTMLRGSAICLGLPFLNAMAWGKEPAQHGKTPPNRFVGVYFPYGINDFDTGSKYAEWGWWPEGDGQSYQLRTAMKPLESMRKRTTIFQGMDHLLARNMNGHGTMDSWLTGGYPRKNSISLDQVIAGHVGEQTRFPSLSLCSERGTGVPGQSYTLSYDANGRPIRSERDPAELFARLFLDPNKGDRAELLHNMHEERSILDQIMDGAKSLEKKVGYEDKEKLDEYLQSIREMEMELIRREKWIDHPKPKVDASRLDLTQKHDGKDPKGYLRVLFDLIVLALQTDSTRAVTFSYAPMYARSFADPWSLAIGLSGTSHNLAHQRSKVHEKPEVIKEKAQWDAWQLEQYVYFLQRLESVKEGEGTLLDRTATLYGSSNSATHNNRNYPLIAAGGEHMGLKHGRYVNYLKDNPKGDGKPMCNLLLRMLQAMGLPDKQFGDSQTPISEI